MRMVVNAFVDLLNDCRNYLVLSNNFIVYSYLLSQYYSYLVPYKYNHFQKPCGVLRNCENKICTVNWAKKSNKSMIVDSDPSY